MKLLLALALALSAVLGDDSKVSSDQPASDVQSRFAGRHLGGVYPGTGYPGTGYPGTGYPGTGYPGTGYPGTGYPGTGYPGTGYPGTGYPGGNPYIRPSYCKNWCRRDNYYPGLGRQQYYCCDRRGPDVYRPQPLVVGPPRPYVYPGGQQIPFSF
ncbi:lamprin 1.8-10-like [Pollicipes pollicipes]|uniref:lamprin 1.8-10-like n=1 Tax=Pollicipes pollicipes TaxID=41117 RepID=UPI0018850795|nr:lamprin 1.8-10-like [Pollicipes pollicipes]